MSKWLIALPRPQAQASRSLLAWVSALAMGVLSACGGSQEAPATITVTKRLDFTACTQPNPVPEEVALIQKKGITPVRRYCQTTLDSVFAAVVPACGEKAYFAHSVLELSPAQLELARSIGYAELTPEAKFGERFDCN